MKKLNHNVLASVLAFAITMTLANSAPAAQADPNTGVVPPGSLAFGKTLAQWEETYWTWLLTGEPAEGKIGEVLLLPMPSADLVPGGTGSVTNPYINVGHLDLTIEAGTPFVLPITAWLGEVYQDGHTDTPFPDSWFGTFIGADVTLDGVPVLKDVTEYYVPATFFKEPIMYSEPTGYGSTGIVYFQGICMVCRPLAVGVHTLTNYTWTLVPPGYENIVPETGIVWDNSWTITVVPKGKM
jgi:hypothetical protein